MLSQKILRFSKEKVWGKHLMGKSYDMSYLCTCGFSVHDLSFVSCFDGSWQPWPLHIQGALLIGQ